MASLSFNRLADDYYDTNKGGFDDGGYDYGQRRGLSPRELFERTPKEEILAYSAKLNESEGFDVSDFPNAFIYGPIRPLPNLSDDELALLTQLAKLALADYNQKQKNQVNTYKFVKVVMANAAAVNGMYYYITFLVVKQQRTSRCDSADDTSSPHETFQARVFYGPFNAPVVNVELCRPKPTHPSPSGSRNEACLSDKDSLLYYGMFAKSEGFDVPDIPNSSEVPGLFRPIKSLDTDNLDKVVKLCKLCTEHYNNKKQLNCKFQNFLKGNKQDGPFGEYYHIEFLVIGKKGKYQTLQAQVLWDEGANPCVELCREKPGAEGSNV